MRQIETLFDHLVRKGNQCGRDSKAKCRGSLEVDNELELVRRLYGKFPRTGAPQDAVDVRRRSPKLLCSVYAIRHQAALDSKISIRINGWYAVLCGRRDNEQVVGCSEKVRKHDEAAAVGRTTRQLDDPLNFGGIGDTARNQLHPERRRACLNGLKVAGIRRRLRIVNKCDLGHTRRSLPEYL